MTKLPDKRRMRVVLQKPLRRIEIAEAGGSGKQPSAGATAVVQEVAREAAQQSSPLSTSPTAKMIKIEEVAEVSSQSPDPSVDLVY